MAFEDPVGEPVVAHVLPVVLDWIEPWIFGRQGDESHVFGHFQLGGDVPAGPVNEQNGVGAGLHGERDLLKVQFHRLGVAKGQDKTERGADGVEDIGRSGSLILQGKRSRATLGPASRDLVLLASAGFVLEPQLERLAGGRGDVRQEVGDFLLKAATATSSCS